MNDCWTFFAFPLNLLLSLLWGIGLMYLWNRCPQSKVVRFLLSPAATLSALLLLLFSCLWLGLYGDPDFAASIPFVIILLYVQTVLFLITLRGWKNQAGTIRWRFLLLHAGLLLALGAGFWGAPDSTELRVVLETGQETQKAYFMNGDVSALGYTLRLDDYRAGYSDDGKPIDYEALISVNGGNPVHLYVNEPYPVKIGEDIYLASVSARHCVLQIVREPWRYCVLTGIVMLLAGAFLLFINGPRR